MTQTEPTRPDMSVQLLRYGVDEPLPNRRLLRAGPVTAVLERGDLRYVTVNGVEVIRRLYMAVRDRNWSTIEPRYTAYDVDGGGDQFRVRFTAAHIQGDVNFVWEGVIEGQPDGTVSYAMDGAPRRAFYRNRIGFCILHPMALAGTPVIVGTSDGSVEGQFPELISPHQPFIDMRWIAHRIDADVGVRLTFDGDLFEMEDQRNWTDASYKTYSTPLRLPYPVLVQPSQRIVQHVTLSVEGRVRTTPAGSESTQADVTVGATPGGSLPAIGFEVAHHGERLDDEQQSRLRRLRPAHLHVDVDLSSAAWEERAQRAVEEAVALATGLQVAVVVAPQQANLVRLASFLVEAKAHVARIVAFPPTNEEVVFPRADLDTDGATLELVRAVFKGAGIEALIGGGTRAYFTEFNRAADRLPLDAMEVGAYTLNPQVHAFDNLSLIETLAAQAETVRSARALAGDMPLAVGPITLRPRFNPNATGHQPATSLHELPPEVDPRQLSLLGAGWTVGSIHRLASAGAAALTYYETTGWRGLMERRGELTRRLLFPSRPGQLFPLYHIFAVLAGAGGGTLLPIALADPLATEALSVQTADRMLLLVASFCDEERVVTVSFPSLANATVRYLDETTASVAMNDPGFLAGAEGERLDFIDGTRALRLKPFAIARIAGRPA
ncbi:MAG: hypothetical protein ACRDJH_02225 [Thermomicrobiales bacterium]